MTLNRSDRPSGITGNALRTWGYVFLLMGIAGQSLIQNHLLGVGSVTTTQLMEILNADSSMMILATIALVCQAVSTCAVPIFAFLLVEGFLHTSDWKRYLTRVSLMALAAEIPYNLAMSSKLIDLSSRNPAFGLVLSFVLMLLFRRYSEKKPANVLLRIVFVVAAVLWSRMLSIADAGAMVIMTTAYWAFRNRPNFRTLVACGAAGMCVTMSMFYLMAPMSAFAINMYNGEPGTQNRAFNYAAYPLTLLCFGVAVLFL